MSVVDFPGGKFREKNNVEDEPLKFALMQLNDKTHPLPIKLHSRDK
jgi:hypothetical protein